MIKDNSFATTDFYIRTIVTGIKGEKQILNNS